MQWSKWVLAAITVAAIPITDVCAQEQKKEPLAFEVASIKPTRATDQRGVIRPMPGNQAYTGTNVTLLLMMTIAYSVPERQISGAPGWVATDRFDIEAKAARPGTIDGVHDMLANLLEERFKLKVRRETKDQPVWNLVVDKGGSKLAAHAPDDINTPPIRMSQANGFEGQNVTMDYFALYFSRFLDRKVINKTGLPARYDFRFRFRRTCLPTLPLQNSFATFPTSSLRYVSSSDLKLESARGPVEYLVVEKVEKLTEN